MGGSLQASEVGDDVTALGLLQKSGAGSESDMESEESKNGEVLLSEGEEQEEVGGSAFRKLMASAVEQSRRMPVVSQVLNARANYLLCKERNFGRSTVLKY